MDNRLVFLTYKEVLDVKRSNLKMDKWFELGTQRRISFHIFKKYNHISNQKIKNF